MSPQRRALIIALLGPAIDAVGLILMLGAAAGGNTPDSFRQVIFDPAILILIVGVLVSVVTLPVALAVYGATAEEVRPAVFPAVEPEEVFRAEDQRGLEVGE